MKKLLSVLLSFCLLSAQVLPTWAQSASSYGAQQLADAHFNQDAQDTTTLAMGEQQAYECANKGNISADQLAQLVNGQVTREVADVFLDKIGCWLDSMEKAVNEQDSSAIKKSLEDTKPLSKSPEEIATDQLVVQTLLDLSNYYPIQSDYKNIYESPGESPMPDFQYSQRATAYLNLLLPSMFDSLEKEPDLQEKAFSFLMAQINPSSCAKAPKNDYDTKCADTLAAADALGGIWKYLKSDEQKSLDIKLTLKELLSKTNLQGPFASSILQSAAISLMTEGVDIYTEVVAVTEKDPSFWNFILEGLGMLSFTNLVEGNKDLWANEKIISSYYVKKGYKNHFNAWADLGRAWGFKALENPGSNIANNLDQTVGVLFKEIYRSVKDIEDRQLEDGIPDEVTRDCPGAAETYYKKDPDGYEHSGCDVVSDPLYPFIVGVFSTGYAPKVYERKYVQAFLRRSYYRGQKRLDAATATYMSNLIALGYYSLGAEVPKELVNGKKENYTCKKYDSTGKIICQHDYIPGKVEDLHENFNTAYKILSGIDIAFLAVGVWTLGKTLCTGAVRAYQFAKLLVTGGREIRAEYGAWRAVQTAFKLSSERGQSIYEYFTASGRDPAKYLNAARNAAKNAANGKNVIATGEGVVNLSTRETNAATQTPKNMGKPPAPPEGTANPPVRGATPTRGATPENPGNPRNPRNTSTANGTPEGGANPAPEGASGAPKNSGTPERTPGQADLKDLDKKVEQQAAKHNPPSNPGSGNNAGNTAGGRVPVAAAKAKKPYVPPKSRVLLGKSERGVNVRLDANVVKWMKDDKTKEIIKEFLKRQKYTEQDITDIFNAVNDSKTGYRYGTNMATSQNLADARSWFDANEDVLEAVRTVQRAIATNADETLTSELMQQILTRNANNEFIGLGKDLLGANNISSSFFLTDDDVAGEVVSKLFRQHLDDVDKAAMTGVPLPQTPSGFDRYTVFEEKIIEKGRVVSTEARVLPEVEFNRVRNQIHIVENLNQGSPWEVNPARIDDIVKSLKGRGIVKVKSVDGRFTYHEGMGVDKGQHFHLMFEAQTRDGQTVIINYVEDARIPGVKPGFRKGQNKTVANLTDNTRYLKKFDLTDNGHEFSYEGRGQFLTKVQKALANEWR